MSKPYWSGPGRGGGSRFADDPPSPPAYQHDPFEPPTENFALDYPVHPDDDDYETYDSYRDTRWRWIAGMAGIVLMVALVAIAFASHGADTATSSATPAPTSAPEQDAVSTTPRTVIATVPPRAPAATAALPPETVVTVTTTPSALDQPQVSPPAAPPVEPVPQVAPPGQTITYTVTGTRQLFDLVTIIYTDEQGFPRTDINVALPWTRTVVLNPGVVTKSVTATSLTGQLNCAVTDASGATLVAQVNNLAIATCTQ